MDTRKSSTHVARALNAGYSRLRSLPDVLVRAWGPEADGTNTWALDYVGTREDLLAAGVCTAAMLEPSSNKGRRAGRVDGEGIPFSVKRWWIRGNGQPIERYKIEIGNRSAESALKFVGAPDAMSHWRRQWYGSEERAAAVQRPRLQRTPTGGHQDGTEQWREKELAVINATLRGMRFTGSVPGKESSFRLSAADACRRDELIDQFRTQLEQLLRSSPLEPTERPRTLPSGQIRLVVDNTR